MIRFFMGLTNLSIAQSASVKPIIEIATQAGLSDTDFEPLGRAKGKLTTEGVDRLTREKQGKLVLVTAITPTPAGEGKTTVTVGLAQGLQKIGVKALPAIREPALGPVFGNKGGACGGGYSQVLPMEEINLFFNGDFPAISAAHNLLSAMLDAHLHHGHEPRPDKRRPTWPRTVDMNDRALRQIIVGLGGSANGFAREDGFVVLPASEVMAILCLATSLPDLKTRLGNIMIGMNFEGGPILAKDLGANGAMTALLRDAFRPNLVQTMEGGPALVHGGPFANIAHGCSSLIATKCGLGMADVVVTEAGFASDLGAEKFLNIKCERLGRGPDAIVLVATVRALAHHGSGDLTAGLENLRRHVSHLKQYGPPVVVAVNRFASDSKKDLDTILAFAKGLGIEAFLADPWNRGGEGCRGLAEGVKAAIETPSSFKPLYTSADPVEKRLHKVVTKVYGGEGYELSEAAARRLKWCKKHGIAGLSLCVAKTQSSFSDDASLINAPTGFMIKIREFRPSLGAGLLVAVAGDILLMPGLGKEPAAKSIDVNEAGEIVGLV
jgi:formate--tetrahydrofolate ligase